MFYSVEAPATNSGGQAIGTSVICHFKLLFNAKTFTRDIKGRMKKSCESEDAVIIQFSLETSSYNN